METKTRYHKDESTGLTLRVEETPDGKGGIAITCQIANPLIVKEGQVFALPFDVPQSEREKEREARALAIFGYVPGR